MPADSQHDFRAMPAGKPHRVAPAGEPHLVARGYGGAGLPLPHEAGGRAAAAEYEGPYWVEVKGLRHGWE